MERAEIYGPYRQADRQAVRRARQVPARARQRLRPRTPSAPHTLSHPSTPGTRTPSTPPVPSRAAKTAARREPPRMVSWWHARRLHARARQAAMPRRQRRASHRPLARARQVRCRCRAEPPRQAARRRLHARARQVPRRRGHIRGCNVNQHSRKTMQRAEGAEWKLSTSSASPKLLSLIAFLIDYSTTSHLDLRPLPQAAFYHRSSTSHPTRPTVQIGAMCTHLCIFLCMRHGPSNVLMSVRVMVCHCHAKTKP